MYTELLTALTQLRAELISGKCQSDLKMTDKLVESFHEVFCRRVKQSNADAINVLWRKLSVRFHRDNDSKNDEVVTWFDRTFGAGEVFKAYWGAKEIGVNNRSTHASKHENTSPSSRPHFDQRYHQSARECLINLKSQLQIQF